ncbi:MAG: tetratricopeptide repeat protein, partial [Rickettsiaceae bacterium]|nr:tetratricopeptide repeat protein [Rickettsiaceae bacterium]
MRIVSTIANEEQTQRYNQIKFDPGLLRDNPDWMKVASNDGKTLLDIAIEEQNTYLLNIILDFGFSPNLSAIVPNEHAHLQLSPLGRVVQRATELFETENPDIHTLLSLNAMKDILIDHGADKIPFSHAAKEKALIKKLTNHIGISQKQINRNNNNIINEKIIEHLFNGLQPDQDILSNFYNSLKATMHNTIVALKSLATGNIKGTNGIDGFICELLTNIPIAGYIAGYVYNQHLVREFKKEAAFFTSNTQTDEVVNDFSIRMVQFYKDDILEPDMDVGLIEQLAFAIDKSFDTREIAERAITTFRRALGLAPPLIPTNQTLGINEEGHEKLAKNLIAKFIYFLKSYPVTYDIDLGIVAAETMLPSASKIHNFSVRDLALDNSVTNILNNIFLFGAMSELAYESKAIIEKCAKKLGFDSGIKDILIQQHDFIKSFVIHKGDECIIVFRGTYHHEVNWFSNFDTALVHINVKNYPINVHKGFFSALTSHWIESEQVGIKHKITSYKSDHPNAKYYLAGHSLGGALAHLCALKLVDLGVESNNIYLYTYGQPRCYDQISDDTVKSLIPENHYYRVVNQFDPVIDLPAQEGFGLVPNYRHCGTLVYFNGQVQMNPPSAINFAQKLLRWQEHLMFPYMQNIENAIKMNQIAPKAGASLLFETRKLKQIISDNSSWHHKISQEEIADHALTPWHIAAIKGDVDTINALGNQIIGQNTINTPDKYGISPLDLALVNGKDDAAAALIKNRIATGGSSKVKYSANHNNLLPGLKEYLQNGDFAQSLLSFVDILPIEETSKKEERKKILSYALSNNKYFTAQAFISLGVEYDIAEALEIWLLKVCAKDSKLEALYYHFTEKLKQKSSWEKTKIKLKLLALENNNISVLEDLYLGENLYDEEGYHKLASNERTKALSKIYKKVGWEISIEEARFGLHINKLDSSGSTLLYKLTVQSRDYNQDKLDHIDTILKYGADINLSARADGKTPLHAAITSYDAVVIKKLLQKANLLSFRAKDIRGNTIQEIDEICEQTDISTLLQDKKNELEKEELVPKKSQNTRKTSYVKQKPTDNQEGNIPVNSEYESLQHKLTSMMHNNPKSNNDKIDSEIGAKYKSIPNEGGGDCAVFAVRDALVLPKNVDVNTLRVDICRSVKMLYDLSELNLKHKIKDHIVTNEEDQQYILNKLIPKYKEVFSNEFPIMKGVILRKIPTDQQNPDPFREIRDMITGCESWEDFTNQSTIIGHLSPALRVLEYVTVMNLTSIFQDHTESSKREINIENYVDYASKQGVWLNNSEIAAYLLGKGFVQEDIADEIIGKGTYFKFKSVINNQTIYIHNNGIDRQGDDGNLSAGTHWQAAILNLELSDKVSSDIQEVEQNQAKQSFVNYQDALNEGDIHIGLGNYQEAISSYDEAIKLNSDYLEDYINKGLALAALEEENKKIAEESEISIQSEEKDHITKQVEQNIKPENLPNYKDALKKGKELLALKKYEDAIDSFDEVIRQNPNDAAVYHHKGVGLLMLGRYHDAIALFNKAISLNPDHVDAHYNKGLALEKLGNYQDAINSYDAALIINPNLAPLHNSKGAALYCLKNYSEAVDSYAQAIRIDPDYVDAYFNKGIALEKLGNYQNAINSYDEAIILKPNDPDAYNSKGYALIELGRYIDAIGSFDEAIRLKPDHVDTYYYKAFALEKLGRQLEAINLYNQLIRIDPDYLDAHNNKGVILSKLGRHIEAIDSFNEA